MSATDERVEAVARAVARNLMEQDEGEPVEPPADWNFKWPWLDQGEVDFRWIGRDVLAALPPDPLEAEKVAALAWCRANGNPHREMGDG